MTDKSTSACRVSNIHLNSTSLINASQLKHKRTTKKKKNRRQSDHTSILAKTTSICSYNNTMRKSDMIIKNFSTKLKQANKKQTRKKKTVRKSQKYASFDHNSSQQINQYNLKQLNDISKLHKKGSIQQFKIKPKVEIRNNFYQTVFQKTFNILKLYQKKCKRLKKQKEQYKNRYQYVAEKLNGLKGSKKNRV